MGYETPKDLDMLKKTAEALEARGVSAYIADSGETARQKLFELIPEGSAVMNMTSRTLESIGAVTELLEGGKFHAIRNEFSKMNKAKEGWRMKELGVAPEVAIGSVQAVTQKGEIVCASATGSQLPAYAYGADKVIWVVGSQKIVKDLDEGMKRIYEYVLLLESARANKAYNISTGSSVNKLLIINREITPNRSHLILVKEALGF